MTRRSRRGCNAVLPQHLHGSYGEANLVAYYCTGHRCSLKLYVSHRRRSSTKVLDAKPLRQETGRRRTGRFHLLTTVNVAVFDLVPSFHSTSASYIPYCMQIEKSRLACREDEVPLARYKRPSPSIMDEETISTASKPIGFKPSSIKNPLSSPSMHCTTPASAYRAENC